LIGEEGTMAGTTRTGKGTAKGETRGDDGAWTREELAEVKARLLAEIEELKADIERAEARMAAETIESDGDDEADAGAKTYEREREIALSLNARDLLAQNERAIARVDAGTYGVCESCQRPIGKERLRAFPRATLCMACKQREERR
jgi:DnaK suppressor protein